MINWASIQTWSPGPLQEGASLAQHRANQLDSAANDLERAGARIQSTGETAEAARRSAREHTNTATTLSRQLNSLERALSQGSTAVAQLNTQVRNCHTFAATTGMIIAPTGMVSIGPTVRATAIAQQVAMRLPTYTATPAWIKGMADQATLTGMVRGAVAYAGAIDSQLSAAVGAAMNTPVTTSANGSAPNIQLVSNSIDLSDELGDSGKNRGSGPQLPLNESDYWNPPEVKNRVDVAEKIDPNKTFPPEGFKLEPNTAYTVHQGGNEQMLRGTYYTDENGNITHVEANASREEGAPLNYDLREPAPNTTYHVMNAQGEGSTTYITDNLGRTETVIIDDLDDKKGARHPGIQSTIGQMGSYEGGSKESGNKVYDYNGGHAVAAQFGGIRENINLTPQLADVNQANSNADFQKNGPNYGRLENMWKAELDKGKEVDVVIHHVYDSDLQKQHKLIDQVPTSYIVDYSSDGNISSTYVFDNTP